MSRSRAFELLRRSLATSVYAAKEGISPQEAVEVGESIRISRRQALALAAVTAGSLACGDDQPDPSENPPGFTGRVAVVGAGAAGLACAYRLKIYGIQPYVFEGSSRVGGRMYSTTMGLADSQVAELGGELVDSNHPRVQALVSAFGLTLDDLFANEPANHRRDTWWFDGRNVTEAEIVEKFTPLAAQMATALAEAEADETKFASLDDMGMKAWLDAQTGIDPLIRSIIEIAYRGEYGLEIEEQSVFNLLYLIDFETPDPFRIFGDSDQRYHIHGGNELLIKALEAEVQGAITLDRKLTKMKATANGSIELTFTKNDGSSVSEVFEKVVLAIPFTLLREVEMVGIELPADKKKAIQELGYGTNAKLMAQFTSRVWKEVHNASGSAITDNGIEETWDTSRGQDGASGIITNFVGGAEGVAMGDKTPEEQVTDRLDRLDEIYPGTKAAYRTGTALRMHWPTAPLHKGSYACYKPGQWAFAGVEGSAVGNLHFCGEHTSIDFQGYMEGAIESGERVADELKAIIGDNTADLSPIRPRGFLRKHKRANFARGIRR